MIQTKHFVNCKKSNTILKYSSFYMMVEGFGDLKIGKEIQSENIRFLDSDDTWGVRIRKIKNEYKIFTELEFRLQTTVKTKAWSCLVSGTINGNRFQTPDLPIYQKNLSFYHNPIFDTEKQASLELKLEMKIFQSDDSQITEKFVDTTAQLKSIISNNESILTDAKYSDFTFIIGEQIFKVHKNILAAASPVFDKMFETNLEESRSNECRITDIEPHIFQFLLNFIYCGKLPEELHEQHVSRKLFEAAHCYQIKELVNIYVSVEHYKLSKENAVDMYEWADTYDLEEIKTHAWKIIQYDILEVFDKKQPPSIDAMRSLISTNEKRKKCLKQFRLQLSQFEAATNNLLK